MGMRHGIFMKNYIYNNSYNITIIELSVNSSITEETKVLTNKGENHTDTYNLGIFKCFFVDNGNILPRV